MEISSEKRYILCKGIDELIEVKKYEIEAIKQRTEEDYKVAMMLMKENFSLNEVKMRDILKKEKEIQDLRAFREEINNLRNRLLLVPNYIQLQLVGK